MKTSSGQKSAAIILAVGMVLQTAAGGALAQETGTPLQFTVIVNRAKIGDAEAQLALGEAYEKGQNVEKSYLKAATWYKQSLRQGNLEATFRLARLLHRGGGKLAKSPELAAQLYRRGAQMGHAKSQNWLGYCNQFGFGMAQDYSKALSWYRKSAEQGLAIARNNLGMLYLSGKGINQDYVKAARLFTAAVKQRYPWAQNNLGGLYEMGWGVRKNAKRARDLYRAAAAAGVEQAKKNLKRVTLAQARADAKAAARASAASKSTNNSIR